MVEVMFKKIQDTHSAVTFTNEQIRFTVPIAGIYELSVVHIKSISCSINGGFYVEGFSPEDNNTINVLKYLYSFNDGDIIALDNIDYIKSFGINRTSFDMAERCSVVYEQHLQIPKATIQEIQEVTKKNLNFETIQLRF